MFFADCYRSPRAESLERLVIRCFFLRKVNICTFFITPCWKWFICWRIIGFRHQENQKCLLNGKHCLKLHPVKPLDPSTHHTWCLLIAGLATKKKTGAIVFFPSRCYSRFSSTRDSWLHPNCLNVYRAQSRVKISSVRRQQRVWDL